MLPTKPEALLGVLVIPDYTELYLTSEEFHSAIEHLCRFLPDFVKFLADHAAQSDASTRKQVEALMRGEEM